MKRTRNRLTPLAPLAVLAVLTAWVLAPAPPAHASKEIAEQEGLVCTACHDKPGSKLLTDQGKYYELMRSLEGYDEIESAFGGCTSCHVKKPGSKKLTPTGKRLALVFDDMEALRQWIMAQHPQPPGEEAEPPAPGGSTEEESRGEEGSEPAAGI